MQPGTALGRGAGRRQSPVAVAEIPVGLLRQLTVMVARAVLLDAAAKARY